MKKIIAASILSLMLLGVGSASANNTFRWADGNNVSPELCVDAHRNGIILEEVFKGKYGEYELVMLFNNSLFNLIYNRNYPDVYIDTINCVEVPEYFK